MIEFYFPFFSCLNYLGNIYLTVYGYTRNIQYEIVNYIQAFLDDRFCDGESLLIKLVKNWLMKSFLQR